MVNNAHDDRNLTVSETSFRLLIEGVVDYAIYLLDPDGIITSWNAGAERIKGHVLPSAGPPSGRARQLACNRATDR
jgi:hypothetical protein